MMEHSNTQSSENQNVTILRLLFNLLMLGLIGYFSHLYILYIRQDFAFYKGLFYKTADVVLENRKIEKGADILVQYKEIIRKQEAKKEAAKQQKNRTIPPQVSAKARQLSSSCENSKECIAVKLFQYVQSNVAVENVMKEKWDPDAQVDAAKVLLNNKGTAGEISVLLASMLHAMRIQTDIVTVPGHNYIFVKGLHPERFLSQVRTHCTRLLLYNTSYRLDKSVQIPINKEMVSAGRLVFRMAADQSLNMTVFCSYDDYMAYLNHNEYKYRAKYSLKGIKAYNNYVDFQVGDLLVLDSPLDDNIQCSVSFYNDISTLLTKIKIYKDEKGEVLIPLDASIKGWNVLPGMELDILSIQKKIAPFKIDG